MATMAIIQYLLMITSRYIEINGSNWSKVHVCYPGYGGGSSELKHYIVLLLATAIILSVEKESLLCGMVVGEVHQHSTRPTTLRGIMCNPLVFICTYLVNI